MDRSLRSLRSSSRLAVVVFAAALLPSGCSDKSAAASSDATAVLQAQLDAGEHHATAPDATVCDDSAMPASSGEDLDSRMTHLLEAIAQNNPDLAADALFPRDAYVALKDVPDPQKVWEKRVSNPFRHSVERMHKRMKGIERARFVSFEIGRSIVQVSPKKKEFKKPLWRVKHSKLSFTIDGKPRQIDVAEMTAWRGAWYVTRLR
jgi:hypothetical protein